jgi:hypothetical protein
MGTEEFHALQIVPHFIRKRISFISHVTCFEVNSEAYFGNTWEKLNIYIYIYIYVKARRTSCP